MAEDKKFKAELVTQMFTLSTNAFGLIAALAWNNVIQELVEGYIKPLVGEGSSLISLLLYALLVTGLAVLVTYQFSRVKEKLTQSV